MAYSVLSGDIFRGLLYEVDGAQSVVYNGITYTTGQRFRGVAGVKNFIYSGTGTQLLVEVLELTAGAVEYVETATAQPVYANPTTLKGFSVEYDLNTAEKIVQEITKIKGFAIELIDYPFYSFSIIETRL